MLCGAWQWCFFGWQALFRQLNWLVDSPISLHCCCVADRATGASESFGGCRGCLVGWQMCFLGHGSGPWLAENVWTMDIGLHCVGVATAFLAACLETFGCSCLWVKEFRNNGWVAGETACKGIFLAH